MIVKCHVWCISVYLNTEVCVYACIASDRQSQSTSLQCVVFKCFVGIQNFIAANNRECVGYFVEFLFKHGIRLEVLHSTMKLPAQCNG